jgi:hypothetical protein
MNRQEHLNWCKQRALEYIKTGDVNNAWASMCSDMDKHPETKGHSAINLGTMLIMSGGLSTATEMKKFIEGFN